MSSTTRGCSGHVGHRTATRAHLGVPARHSPRNAVAHQAAPDRDARPGHHDDRVGRADLNGARNQAIRISVDRRDFRPILGRTPTGMTAPKDHRCGVTTIGVQSVRIPVAGPNIQRRNASTTVARRDRTRHRPDLRIAESSSIATTRGGPSAAARLGVGQHETTARVDRDDHRVGRFGGRDHGETMCRAMRGRDREIGDRIAPVTLVPALGRALVRTLEAVAANDEFVNARSNHMDAQCRFTIAIDGPAAAGKSTVGEMVALRLHSVYFDTGLLYRAVTRAGIDRGVPLDDGEQLAAMVRECDIQVRRPTVDDGRQSDVLVDAEDVTTRLRGPDIDQNVSVVAAHPAVRTVLLETQRRIGTSGCVVMVGRDIGTVVLPDADVKIFLDASPEERARRRYQQLSDGNAELSYDQILDDLRRRDAIDSERDVAPLRPADDAEVIDSDALTIEQVAERIIEVANGRLRQVACP